MPICFPRGQKFPDTHGVVYAAGWGYLGETTCKTGEHGPDPYSRCRFPFIWGDIPFSRCAYTSSPSVANEHCTDLKKSIKKALPDKGYSRVRTFEKMVFC